MDGKAWWVTDHGVTRVEPDLAIKLQAPPSNKN